MPRDSKPPRSQRLELTTYHARRLRAVLSAVLDELDAQQGDSVLTHTVAVPCYTLTVDSLAASFINDTSVVIELTNKE